MKHIKTLSSAAPKQAMAVEESKKCEKKNKGCVQNGEE